MDTRFAAGGGARREDHLMNESVARAERYEIPSSAPPFYLWEVSQKPVCVKLPFPLIDRLEHDVVENFRSLSSKGSELGGLLLGKAFAGSPAMVSVEDYELIACDYSRGPLYRLSDADRERFERAIALHATGLPAIGFFRSHTRKGLALDPEDVALLDARFAAPHQIALLVRPFATKPSLGGIFIREDGVVHGEASHKEFSFRSSELTPSTRREEKVEPEIPAGALGTALPTPAVPRSMARGQIVPIASRREVPPAAPPAAPEPPQTASASPAAVEPPPASAAVLPPLPAIPPLPPAPAPAAAAAPATPPVEDETPPPEPVTQDQFKSEIIPAGEVLEVEAEPVTARGTKFLRLAIAAAAGLIVIVGLFVYPGLLIRHGAKTPAAASQDSSALALRVQRNGGEILLTWNRDADVIRDATHAVLSISDGEQRENVEMDVAQLRIGSITYTPATADVVFKMEVTGKGQSKTTSESIRALQMRPSPMPQPGQASQPGPTGSTKPAAEAVAPEGAAPSAQDAQPQTPARQLPAFRTESLAQRLRPSSPVSLPDAPSLGGVQASPSAIPGLNLNGTAPPPPPAAAKSSTPPAPAASKPQTGGQIVQAQLIHKKDPEYPKIARDAGAKGIVELLATIGTDGRVKSVQVLNGHPMLRKAAQDAVMQWVYRPTLLNGVAVEAPVQVTVNFQGR